MKKWLMFFIIAAFIITSTLWLWEQQNYIMSDDGSPVAATVNDDVDLNTFLSLYKDGTFHTIKLEDELYLKWYEAVVFTGEQVTKTIFGKEITWGNNVYTALKPTDTSLTDLGIALDGETNVEVYYNEARAFQNLILKEVLPIILMVVIFIVIFRMFMPKWGMSPFSPKAWVLRTKANVKTTFADVAGMEEVKQELVEVVDFLRNPWKYEKIGAKIPKWVLLYGPPGSGKTLLAKAVAWEAGVAFFSASGSEFMEMLVGMWAAKIRELFKKAKAASPAIIYIDEIDSIGKKRGNWQTGGHQEQEQTLNQILTEMDGFGTNTNVIVIAATNRLDTLDPALMRSGRFDRK